ncbi:MAG: D-alanyl-D-alanine dipeptidase [Comamonadaceae bacterium CG_4_9_14_3_um_filter_60_33]|nr:MAG: D-alanyl-D-alanine dipeptidase [Comamonadaceae bacterium CG2_30_59_20]PIY29758.1 MAG: D-alanyl-D-alanine dipeptidase [Comamonadaceae bacterium CG_4_10_14_3_um_filter_60_42]PJB44105.1 MAG: D-alanyl-D-alanine dipeptidase [Comamonadaceae bacterium CG_4_9_14_3_um_filter_60_33]
MPLREINHSAIDVDLRYAGPDNFTGKTIYDHAVAYLHQDALAALVRAAELAAAQGLRLRVLDAYRPSAAQWRLWTALPDPRFVADPRVGSVHTRGVAVDLTLCDASGAPLDMGTAFDEMTELSFHGATNIADVAQRNRGLLLALMTQAGWTHHPYEWWHYNLPEPTRYPLLSDGAEGSFLMD